MSRPTVIVSLYHSEQCRYCIEFMPTWKKLKEAAKNVANMQILLYDYEPTRNPEEVSRAEIAGFPTIIITKDGYSYEYIGKRTVEDLLADITSLRLGQKGGSANYYNKYIKYKTKYLESRCKK